MNSEECLVCSLELAGPIMQLDTLLRVTSDSRIWEAGGSLARCEHCGTVQKVLTDAVRRDIERVYGSYDLYFQGDGSEQKLFVNGVGRPRSSWLLEAFFRQRPDVLGRGHLSWLDLGCGKGHLLRALGDVRPEWALFGLDLGEGNRRFVESIPGFRRYWAGDIDRVDETFDVVSLSHVLEHVFDPLSFLVRLRRRLRPGGSVVIAVPDAAKNPFDLLVVDHCLHFDPRSVEALVSAAGFANVRVDDRSLGKELVVTASRGADPCPVTIDAPQVESGPGITGGNWLNVSVGWLAAMVRWAEGRVTGPAVGVLGTALAATWLDHSVGSRFAFFVDEDPSRSGQLYLGRPVYVPTQVPPGTTVLVPLAGAFGRNLCERLNRMSGRVYVPPPAVEIV